MVREMFGGSWNRIHATEEHQLGKGCSKNKRTPPPTNDSPLPPNSSSQQPPPTSPDPSLELEANATTTSNYDMGFLWGWSNSLCLFSAPFSSYFLPEPNPLSFIIHLHQNLPFLYLLYYIFQNTFNHMSSRHIYIYAVLFSVQNIIIPFHKTHTDVTQ